MTKPRIQPDYSITYGSRYEETKSEDIKSIAKRVRKDIKLAIKQGVLSEDIKVRVSISRKGHGSIRATVVEAPYDYRRMPDDDEVARYGSMARPVTDEAKRTEDILKAILGAYNYDGSDSSFDYFNVRFYAFACHRID